MSCHALQQLLRIYIFKLLQPDPECLTSQWSDWSPCSVRCGPGVRVRERKLLSPPERQELCAARRQLTQQHPCTGPQHCTIDISKAKSEFHTTPLKNVKQFCFVFKFKLLGLSLDQD